MRYFTLNEFTRSNTAERMGIDNTPPAEAVANIGTLVNVVLDPLRALFGRPIYVNSGYRCEELNRLVGGSKTSAHRYGLAADVRAGSRTLNRELASLLRSSGLPFDQLILYNDVGEGPTFIHVGLALPGRKNRRMVIRK